MLINFVCTDLWHPTERSPLETGEAKQMSKLTLFHRFKSQFQSEFLLLFNFIIIFIMKFLLKCSVFNLSGNGPPYSMESLVALHVQYITQSCMVNFVLICGSVTSD